MECKFAIKYGDKRSFLAKVYPRLTSSVQSPEVKWGDGIRLECY